MQPIALLMKEHRLIERMLPLLRKEAGTAAKMQQPDLAFLDDVVDFIRWYVDKTHHAKEEAILFRDLAKKDMSAGDRKLMEELIEEHEYGRRTVTRLVEAKIRYLRDSGSGEALEAIRVTCETLDGFYRKHIHKEDDIFFPAAMQYLSGEEQETMLREFQESDAKMIHEKYEAVVDQYEKLKG